MRGYDGDAAEPDSQRGVFDYDIAGNGGNFSATAGGISVWRADHFVCWWNYGAVYFRDHAGAFGCAAAGIEVHVSTMGGRICGAGFGAGSDGHVFVAAQVAGARFVGVAGRSGRQTATEQRSFGAELVQFVFAAI